MNQIKKSAVIKARKRPSLPRELKKDSNIISRREIEPLLVKAKQALAYYNEAIGIKAFNYQTGFCEQCKNQSDCDKLHQDALAESRRTDETQVYNCAAGFVYWTSPLYRKGRYAGALTAGQVFPGSREEALDKFSGLAKNRDAANKFADDLGSSGLKSPEEIRSMVRLLEICAEETSEKQDDSGSILHRIVWRDENLKYPLKAQTNKIQAALRQPSSAAADIGPVSPAEKNPEYIMEKERILLAAFRRGDFETGRKILNELVNFLTDDVTLDLEIIRFRVIELVVLLSREAISRNKDSNVLLEANNRYIKRIQNSKNLKELRDNLLAIAKSMAGDVFSFQGLRHASVLRRAERYIWENYTRKISLEEISMSSGLSAPYFSTIFKEEMGENFASYLNRLRVEKAANLLIASAKTLREIAESCGFEDQSWFSKIFKKYAGISPGKFRETGNLRNGIGPKLTKTEEDYE